MISTQKNSLLIFILSRSVETVIENRNYRREASKSDEDVELTIEKYFPENCRKKNGPRGR